jgi:hypothetical protein
MLGLSERNQGRPEKTPKASIYPKIIFFCATRWHRIEGAMGTRNVTALQNHSRQSSAAILRSGILIPLSTPNPEADFSLILLLMEPRSSRYPSVKFDHTSIDVGWMISSGAHTA